MPEEASLKPTNTPVVSTSALSGVSQNDLALAGDTTTAASALDTPVFKDGLKAAQAKDKASKTGAPAEPAKPDAPTPPPAEPVKGVPGLAPAPASDWKPKGESAKQWEQLKQTHASERTKLEGELAALKARLGQFETAGVTEDGLKSLQTERDQYRELLRDVAIERDPEFNRSFKAREGSAIEQAKLAAGDSAAKLEALLKAPSGPWRDEQINSLMDGLPASSQRRVNAALAVLDQVDIERNAAISDRRSTFEQKQLLTQRQAEAQKQQHVAQAAKAFNDEFSRWTDAQEGNPFLREREGDDAGNAEVKNALATAKGLHESYLKGEWTHEDVSKAILHVAASSRAAKTAMEAVARAEKAEAALDRMRGTTPGVGQTSAAKQDAGDNVPPSGTEAYNRHFVNKLKEAQLLDRKARYAL